MIFDYALKTKNSDFRVSEVPLLPEMSLKDAALYTHIWVEKSSFSTFENFN